MKFRWLFLIVLSFFLMIACSESEKEKEKDDCKARGECLITYVYSKDGTFSEFKRVCAKIKKVKDEFCGICRNHKKSTTGKLLAKTCFVCNLCKSDFECLDDSDCKKSQPYCLEGKCVGCRNVADCKEPERPFCPADKCVGCRDDKDCRESDSPQCYQGLCGGCRCEGDKKRCLKNKDRTISCVECTENAHCKAPKPLCDLKTNSCKAGCDKNSDCSPSEFCSLGSCRECRKHSDCKDPRSPRCLTNGFCGCQANQDCPTSFAICTQKRCVECQKTSDCPPGFPRCIGGECSLQLCSNDRQCEHANYPLCRQVARQSVCVGCSKADDCQDGKTCDISSFLCK